MKKILAIIAISLSTLLTAQISSAGPHSDNDRGYDRSDNDRGNRGRNFRDNNDDNIQEKRREREERGVKRLQQHKWQTGYVMPQHYRGNSYKVDYKESDLPKPSRNQQWYKINNDYILVDSDSNNIISIHSM
ncbi:RcnB family protein [Acinetobacter sp. ULE_I010]|uniref:RcnB family protein n=1 Tax=Acinetobacter sp. ULE_I010 TaxID=3373065 RepID=UPI003AF5A626